MVEIIFVTKYCNKLDKLAIWGIIKGNSQTCAELIFCICMCIIFWGNLVRVNNFILALNCNTHL